MRRDEILPLSEIDLCYFDSRGGMYICLHCESLKASMNNSISCSWNSMFHEHLYFQWKCTVCSKTSALFFSFTASSPRLLFLIQKQWLHFPWVRWLLSEQPRCFFNLSWRDYLNDDWNPCCDWIRDCCAIEITKTFSFHCFSWLLKSDWCPRGLVLGNSAMNPGNKSMGKHGLYCFFLHLHETCCRLHS